jgi:PAS domain S-box-containing protein
LGLLLSVLLLLIAAMVINRDIAARHTAEGAVARSRRFLDTVIETLPMMVFVKDARDLRFVMFNKAGEDLLGHARKDLIGKNDYDFFPREEAQFFVGKDRDVLSGRKVVEIPEESVHTRDQGVRLLRTLKVPILDAAGRPEFLLGISQDITEKKQVDEALRAASASLERMNAELEDRVAGRTMELEATNEELRETIEELQSAEEELRQQNDELTMATDAIRISEERLRTAVLHLPLILFNQDRELRFNWLVGSRPGETPPPLMGKTDQEIFRPEDAARLITLKRQVIDTGKGMRTEFTFLREGRWFSYDITLEPLLDSAHRIVGLTGAAIDITARMHADEEFRRTHDELQALVAASPQAILGLDPEGRVLSWHGGAERMFGWTSQEVIGCAPPNVSIAQRDDFRSLCQRVFSGESIGDLEATWTQKNGSAIDVSVSAAPLHEADGRVSGVVIVASDVSSRRQASESQRAKELAEAASRAKSQFLANMSHELRTPLNAIIGFSELLEDRAFGELNDRQLKYVDNILSSGRHLLQLVNDILDLAKIEAGRLVLESSEFEIGTALDEVLRVVDALAMTKAQSVRLDLPKDLPHLTADRGKFKQILYNLLSNAIKFTPAEGSIQVSAACQSAALSSTVSVPALVVSVSDTGIGISPEDLERIFAEFEQVDASYVRQQQGTGLGLALTRRLVELQGGRIWVESELGKGSTFSFVLPLDTSIPRAEAPAIGAAENGAEDERPLVLIVEDEEAASRLLTLYLTNNGYRVAVASSGAEAIALATRLKPVAITLDILLPDRNGLEVLAEMRSREETKNIPVVVVSITETRELGFSLGAAEWLVKPIVGQQFLEAVQRVVVGPTGEHRPRVLVVDDEPATVDMVSDLLESRGFEVLRALQGEDGLRRARSDRPNAIVLDLLMPGMSGFEVVQRLREDPRTRTIPILIFSVKDLTRQEKAELEGKVQRIVSKSGVEDLLHSLRGLERPVQV